MGGDEALGERTAEGMQVCSWMDLVVVRERDEVGPTLVFLVGGEGFGYSL